MLKAVERFPAPKCDADTRRKALAVVKNWIKGGDACDDGEGVCEGGLEHEGGATHNEPIMWLSGAPGVGKSAIIQTACEALLGKNSPVDASHFFGRGKGKREKAFYFPATVAYQIGRSSTVHRTLIRMVIKDDPAVLTEAVDEQFRKLVVDTVAMAEKELLCWKPLTIVIDGLDEVDNVGDQIAILELVFTAATKNGMRFLIASRPEQAIHTFFHRPDVLPYVHHVRLDEETFQTSQDIYVFLVKAFARIRQSRPWFFRRDVLPSDELWPGTTILRQLVAYSDAQFIFSHLIIESIEADTLTHPDEQLRSILMHTASDTFSKLDALYHQILSRCLQGPPSRRHQNKVRLMGILHVIIAWPEELSIAGIADMLDEEKPLVENVIRGPMRCMFKIEDDNPHCYVTLCHKSLRDCVLNHSRAGEFFIGSDNPNLSTLDLLYHEILSRCLRGHPSERDRNKARLIGILRVIIAWPEELSIAGIADVLGEGKPAVENVIQGPMRCLFELSFSLVKLCRASLRTCVLNPNCAGEFFIGSDDPNISTRDALYHEILSRCLRGSPSERDRNKAISMGILRVIICWPLELSIAGIADVLDEEESVVGNVIRGPMRCLFKIHVDNQTSCVALCDRSLKDCVLKTDHAGEFFISSANPDELFIEILSRPPPSDPRHSFPPHLLMDVLQCIQALTCMFTIKASPDVISSILNVDPDIVRNVFHGPHRSLFVPVPQDYWYHPFAVHTFSKFLADNRRSGRFAVPYSQAVGTVVGRMLSIPSPCDPQTSFSRQDLMGVLQVSKMWSKHPLSLLEAAGLLGIAPSVVQNVAGGPQSGLWCMSTGRLQLSKAVVSGNFFSGENRSAGFHVFQESEDALLISLLSRPPPNDPQKSFSRRDLGRVLHVILCFNHSLDIPDIASILRIDPGVVRNIIYGPQEYFFVQEFGGVCFRPNVDDRFFRDASRSGEFYLSDTDAASLPVPILCHSPPPDPERSFTRQDLMRVFLATILLGDRKSTIDDIVALLRMEPDVVRNVVNGPQHLLFRVWARKSDGTVLQTALRDSWFDASYSSQGFCISNAEIDALLIAILARAPPADAQKSYCRQDLMAVICTVLTFNGLTFNELASVAGLEIDIVKNVVQGPHQFLLKMYGYFSYLPLAAIRSFFHNPHRSQQFYISRDDCDAFLIHYLSLPPPDDPKRSYSRQCFIEILRLLFVSNLSTLGRIELYDVASKLNVSRSMVGNVVLGPHKVLFDVNFDYTIKSHWISFESRVPDIKNFLLDPTRSREFYLGP